MSAIGQKTKQVRELRNYSQDYLVQQLGISQKAYSKIELGQTNLSVERLEQIAKIMEVDTTQPLNFDKKYALNNNIQNNRILKNIDTTTKESELYERLLAQRAEEIASLKDEIANLRSLLHHQT